MIHAYNDINLDIDDIKVDGGMAYTIDSYLLPAMHIFKSLEAVIDGASCDSLRESILLNKWDLAWRTADYTGNVYEEPGNWIWSDTVTFTLGDNDAANVKKYYKYHLSCSDISAVYNLLLAEKNCKCFRFVCESTINLSGSIKPSKALPIGLQ